MDAWLGPFKAGLSPSYSGLDCIVWESCQTGP